MRDHAQNTLVESWMKKPVQAVERAVDHAMDGWSKMLGEAAEYFGNHLMSLIEGSLELVGAGASKALGASGAAVMALPANAGRAVAINARSVSMGHSGHSPSVSKGVASWMSPDVDPAPVRVAMQAMPASVRLDDFQGYDHFNHGVSGYAPPRNQEMGLRA